MAFTAHMSRTLMVASTINTERKFIKKKIPIPAKLANVNSTTNTGGLEVASRIKPKSNNAGTIGAAHAIVS